MVLSKTGSGIGVARIILGPGTKYVKFAVDNVSFWGCCLVCRDFLPFGFGNPEAQYDRHGRYGVCTLFHKRARGEIVVAECEVAMQIA